MVFDAELKQAGLEETIIESLDAHAKVMPGEVPNTAAADATVLVPSATPKVEHVFSIKPTAWQEQPETPGLPRTATLQKQMSIAGRKRTCEDNDIPSGPATVWPQPKWPVNHESSAFDAVAIKKALILSPAEIYAEIAHHGEEKAKFHWTKVALLAIMAGMYCGFGFTLCLVVGGNAPKHWLEDSPGLFSLLFGAVGFPFSFTIILVCGAELYTSLCAYMTAAWWEGKVRKRDCVRMWVTSWLWNFVGCAIFVGLMYASGTYKHKDWYIKVLAHKKVSNGWGETLVKGVFANWLVCVATWQANAAQDLTGKAVGIWLPISAFAMLGFEHCIANQFLIPMAMALGAPISAKDFVAYNLIPATIGNWIGGAICMATVYAWTYGTPAKRFTAWLDTRTPCVRPAGSSRWSQFNLTEPLRQAASRNLHTGSVAASWSGSVYSRQEGSSRPWMCGQGKTMHCKYSL